MALHCHEDAVAMYFKNIYNMYRVCGPSLFFGSCVLSLFILNYETVTLFFYFDIAIVDILFCLGKRDWLLLFPSANGYYRQ